MDSLFSLDRLSDRRVGDESARAKKQAVRGYGSTCSAPSRERSSARLRSRFACYSFENGNYTFVVQERQAGISASVSVYQKTSLCTARLLQASLIEKVGSSSADSYTLTFRDGDLEFLIPSISETPLSVPYIKSEF